MDILTREANNILDADGNSVARFEANNIILEDGIGGSSYSLEEKKIGKWIDGTSVYQKTYVYDNPSVNSWNNNIDITDLNINTPVSTNYIFIYNNGTAFSNAGGNYGFVLFNNDNSDLTFFYNYDTCNKAIATIVYTKNE